MSINFQKYNILNLWLKLLECCCLTPLLAFGFDIKRWINKFGSAARKTVVFSSFISIFVAAFAIVFLFCTVFMYLLYLSRTPLEVVSDRVNFGKDDSGKFVSKILLKSEDIAYKQLCFNSKDNIYYKKPSQPELHSKVCDDLRNMYFDRVYLSKNIHNLKA